MAGGVYYCVYGVNTGLCRKCIVCVVYLPSRDQAWRLLITAILLYFELGVNSDLTPQLSLHFAAYLMVNPTAFLHYPSHYQCHFLSTLHYCQLAAENTIRDSIPVVCIS